MDETKAIKLGLFCSSRINDKREKHEMKWINKTEKPHQLISNIEWASGDKIVWCAPACLEVERGGEMPSGRPLGNSGKTLEKMWKSLLRNLLKK
jgi:hypothetical protein